MKRILILGLMIITLSVIATSGTNGEASKDKPEEQAGPPTVTVAPASIDFKEQVTKKTSKPQRITVTNTSRKDLYINSAVVDGDNKDDFAIAHDTCTGSTIKANKSCVIDVVFTPSTNEKRKATLTITDNAADSPQKVTLSGNGINSIDVPPRQL